MNDILNLAASGFSSIEKVSLTSDLKAKFSNPDLLAEAEKNSEKVQAYRFVYKSGNNRVAGFLVAPQTIHSPLPLVVYNRGGSFDFGLVNRGLLMTDIATMASWGYAVVGSQYTGNGLTKMGHDEFGGTKEEKKKRSIIFDVKSLPDVPLLIMHGDADWRVAPTDSAELAERLAELEKPHNLIAYSNDNHGLTNHRKEWLDETHMWFKRYL